MEKIKAVMCDCDGTLLNQQQIVSERNKLAIQKLREQGILFGLCTGRECESVKQLLGIWGLEGMVDAIVGTGGAEIYDFTKKQTIRQFPLEPEVLKTIVQHYQDLDVNFAIPEQGILYVPKDDVLIQTVSKMDRVPYRVVDYDAYCTKPKSKLMIICDPDRMEEVVKRSASLKSDRFQFTSLITTSRLFEYMDPRISKAFGLQTLMELHGIQMEELCTFGDADNDYDMTKAAGVGVVMANGSERTKQVADYLTADCQNDGVAQFIEKYLLPSNM